VAYLNIILRIGVIDYRVCIAVISNLLYTNTKSFILSHSTHETAYALGVFVFIYNLV